MQYGEQRPAIGDELWIKRGAKVPRAIAKHRKVRVVDVWAGEPATARVFIRDYQGREHNLPMSDLQWPTHYPYKGGDRYESHPEGQIAIREKRRRILAKATDDSGGCIAQAEALEWILRRNDAPYLLRPERMESGFNRAATADYLRQLADDDIFIGACSWKYPDWLGQVYTEERYLTRGRFSKKRFEEECLIEYAETFPSVEVDAFYYQFPKPALLGEWRDMVPPHFRFSFKVTDALTLKNFPPMYRQAKLAGRPNEHYLSAQVFEDAFLSALHPIRENVGVIMFEFSPFKKGDYAQGREFMEDLDRFLTDLPAGWQYGIEIRNAGFFTLDYLRMLARHNIAHVFNSWNKMPSVVDQLMLEGSETADFVAARFLTPPGIGYEASVKRFPDYTTARAPEPVAQSGLAEVFTRAKASRRPSYLYVNNRLEGNAPMTIERTLC